MKDDEDGAFPLKTNMTGWNNNHFEDVFPIENVFFFIVMLVCFLECKKLNFSCPPLEQVFFEQCLFDFFTENVQVWIFTTTFLSICNSMEIPSISW